MIAHIVLFNLKPSILKAEMRSFIRELERLLRAIPSVQRATIGRSIQVDAGYPRAFGDRAFNFVAVLEFADTDGLVSYLRHPLHGEVGRKFWEYCDAASIVESRMADVMSGPAIHEELLDDLPEARE